MADYEIEADIEKRILAHCVKQKWMCLKLALVSEIGFPDRTIITNSGVIFIEIKRARGGKLSKQQEYWLRKLSSMDGCKAACVDSFNSFLCAVEGYL